MPARLASRVSTNMHRGWAPAPAGLSHIRKQFEEERLIPSRQVHLAGDGAWHRVRTQDVQRHASNDRQIARRVVLAGSGVVLAKHHIELAVEVVLYAPVPSRDRQWSCPGLVEPGRLSQESPTMPRHVYLIRL